MARVMVGMSGGVDSSAAALVLLRQGYDVCGTTLLLCPDASPDSAEVSDARAVCEKLGIEHRCVDLRQRFADDVMRYFCNEYRIGKTPNPCIECNRRIKFGAMMDIADEIGCDYIATGHYARIISDGGEYKLMRASSRKDQSYVLWTLTQSRLARILLPLCDMEKDALRTLVREADLPIHAKPDSQDICFIPDGDYARFLREYAGIDPPKGNFVDAAGRIIGTHNGITKYTIGQRKGLGGGFPEPMYVTRIKVDTNEIVLGGEGSQYSRACLCDSVHLISDRPHDRDIEASVKVRYSAPMAPAHIEFLDGDRVRIEFESPQRAVTPGQSAVFYSGDIVLGGGIISEIL